MKNGKRIAAFALSLVVALGSVCYRPPKAEAVVAESALASAAISTYLSATGFEFFGGGSSNTEINEAIHGELCELTKAFAESINQLNDEVTSVITSGVTWAENGIVKFSAAAANMLGRFEDWLIDKFGLTAGGDSVPIYSSSSDGFTCFDENGNQYEYKFAEIVYTSGAPYILLGTDTTGWPEYTYLQNDGQARKYVKWLRSSGSYNSNGLLGTFVWYDSISSTYLYELYPQIQRRHIIRDGVNSQWIFTNSAQDSQGYYRLSEAKYFPFSEYSWIDEFFCFESSEVAFGLSPDYEAAPNVNDQYSMVIDTGLTFADEQGYIDAVLGGVAAGTLSSTYTIEETTAGDVTVPGEDAEDDTQVGILNWVKKIWQSVKELPQTIADAVANVFVPSEEYMATVPETIADTFGSRTGFLTYPTSVLYDFVDMLSETSGDFILSWPTVREPSTGGVMMEAGQFNVSKFVRDNQSLSDWYIIYRYAVGAYLTFLFFGLCRRKYNSVVGDRLGV